METPTFIFYTSSSEDEIKITKEILNGEIITKQNKKEITERVLKLDFIAQLQIVNCIHALHYNMTNENSGILDFLAQDCFNIHRDILYDIMDEDANLEKISEKYNMKIERPEY
jgi:hypothetical protein